MKGFGLQELLVYVACSILFITLVGTCTLELHRSTKRHALLNERLVELAVALDRICKIIEAAPREKRLWKLNNESAAIFRTDRGDRGIVVENGRLLSMIGIFDRVQHCWLKRSSSVLLEHARMRITFYYSAGSLVGLRIQLTALVGDQSDVTLEVFIATKVEDVS